MDARTGRRQKKISGRQERETARDLGGRTMPASGALPESGGDVRKMGELRVECKYTDKDHYVLELSILEKVKLQAIKGGLEAPVLQLGFRDQYGRLDNYAILPWSPRLPRPALRIATDAKSTRLYHQQLRMGLVNGAKMAVCFGPSEFEVMHWDDYLNQLGAQ